MPTKEYGMHYRIHKVVHEDNLLWKIGGRGKISSVCVCVCVLDMVFYAEANEQKKKG